MKAYDCRHPADGTCLTSP